MVDKNYCPSCDAFLPSDPHKPMCELVEALELAITLFPHYPAGSSLAKKVDKVKAVFQAAKQQTKEAV